MSYAAICTDQWNIMNKKDQDKSAMKKAKHILMDVTFLFIVRLDSIDRLENILVSSQYIYSNFQTKIMVSEYSPYNNGILEKLLDRNIIYQFHEDHDPVLFRTRYINQMLSLVETPYVAVWDADVIIEESQIIEAVNLLRNNYADFVYPYEKFALDTSQILRRLFMQEGKLELLKQNIKKMKEMYTPNPLGGAFFADMDAYRKAGLENENFYGWGLEDGERYYRWQILGYRIRRVPGPLFHLSHSRGLNSVFHNSDQKLLKRKEILEVKRGKING